MQDDVTHELLMIREDYKESTIRNRLALYHRSTEPLISYYVNWNKNQITTKPKFIKVDSGKDKKIGDMFQDILRALKNSQD